MNVEQNLDRSLWLAKGYYFAFFAGLGALVPFFNVYLENKGLSGLQIGLIGSISPLIALLANPFWGGLVDRWQVQRGVLTACAVISGLIMPLFLFTNQFVWLLLLNIGLTFFRSPMMAIGDSVVINLVKQAGSSYGRQRLWGSVSFVLASYGLANLISLNDLRPLFWFHAVMIAGVCALMVWLLPVERTTAPVNFRAGLRTLLKLRSYNSLLVAIALYGIGMASYLNFLGNHLIVLGASSRQVGLVFACNAIAEIPMMYLGAQIVARLGNRRIINGAMIGIATIWLAMALTNRPLPIIVLASLIGFGFGLLWPAVVNYANDNAPEGMSATAQAIVGAANAGVGWGIGALVAGQLWDAFGGQALFFNAAFFAALAATIFWWMNRGGVSSEG